MLRRKGIPMSVAFKVTFKLITRSFLMMLLVFSFAAAYEEVQASPVIKFQVNSDDKAVVLQKIVDLQELQSLYAKRADGTFKPLSIMQHGIIFPTNIQVKHQGNDLTFIDKSQSKGGAIEGYFLFNQFEIKDGKAWVDGVYYYDQTSAEKKSEVFTLELEKVNGNWTITKSQIERRDI